MDRNSKFLNLFFIVVATLITLTGCSENNSEEVEYKYVDWIPSNKDIAGKYILERNYHNDLPKDSIFLEFNENNTFIAKNFFYSEFKWDSVKLIPYAEGIWSIEKKGNSLYNKMSLTLNDNYSQYNGLDSFQNKNNIFLTIPEMQMNKKDSLFVLTILSGDPDHSKNRYYYYQQK